MSDNRTFVAQITYISCILNDMAIKRDRKMTLRLSVAEEEMRDEIARRTGLAASAVMRIALLEKGERMGLTLKQEKPPARGRGRER